MAEQTSSEQRYSEADALDAIRLSDQRYSRPLGRARSARHTLIGLTHDLPKDAPQDVLRLWNAADTALLAFIRQLEKQVGYR